jgi:hypothetical protein
VVSLAALAWTANPSDADAQSIPPSLAQFLQQTIGLHRDDLTAVTSGKATTKLLESSDRHEIAVFGIVRIDVPRSFYIQRAADFRSSLRTATRLRFGIFSDPAVPADLAGLSLPHNDVQDLGHCRVGACKLKLSAETIDRVRAIIDSAPPAADSVASTYLRKRMIDYVTGYRARGNPALVAYADEDSMTGAAEVLAAMLSRSPYVYQYAPSLERYLQNYPRDRPADVAEVLFWAEDDLPSLKPTITITHEVVYSPPELPGCTLIVAKQLYADHYLDGGIDLTAVVDQGSEPSGVYLVYLRRLHFDELPSGGLMDVRGRAMGRLLDQTRAALGEAKTDSERAYATRSAPSR